MFLDDVLQQCTFDQLGIKANGIPPMKLFKFIREAILDRYIYLYKVAGYKLTSTLKAHYGVDISRSRDMCDSYIEMAVNLSDKLFYDSPNKLILAIVTSDCYTVDTVTFKGNATTYHPLYTNPYCCRSVDGKPREVTLYLRYGNSYASMYSNYKYLNDESFFPCVTDFTLDPFIRVLPRPNDTPDSEDLIRLRYYNGMTPEIFKGIMTSWSSYMHEVARPTNDDNAQNIKGVQKWLSNFEH